jgi:transposase-like protein
MERRKFTREFKFEAVRLIKDRGVSYAQASQDLSIHPSCSDSLPTASQSDGVFGSDHLPRQRAVASEN